MIQYPGIKFDTTYKGKVVQRIDPLRLGRLKVRVFGVHSDDIKEEDLPWAWPTLPGSDQCGIWFIPPLGSWVRIRFEEKDCEYPIWEGGWWSSESPEFGQNETANATKQSKHYKFPTSWFGSQEKYPDNSILRTDKAKGADPKDAPNNFVFSSPEQKRLELDDRKGRHKIALADFWGNIFYINSENAVLSIESSNGVRTVDSQGRRIDKPRGMVFNSDSVNGIEQVQVYTFAGWRMTWDDVKKIWETTSPDGNLIRINSTLQRIEVWSRDGNKLILDDAAERIEVSTTDDRKLLLDDKHKVCALIGQNDDYHLLIDENRQFVEVYSGGALHLKASGKVNITAGGTINLDGSTVQLNSGFSDSSNLLQRPSSYVKPERLRLTPKAWEYKYYEDPEKV
jgi:hypothetical protein